MSDISSLLKAAAAGDRQAADQAFALLYADLQRLAHSRMSRSGSMTMLDTTALVHESWLRFQGASDAVFADKQHFMGYAARVMHSVVVDFVRARRAAKHGGDVEHVTLNTAIGDALARHDDEILRVDEAMQQLAVADQPPPRRGRTALLRRAGRGRDRRDPGRHRAHGAARLAQGTAVPVRGIEFMNARIAARATETR